LYHIETNNKGGEVGPVEAKNLMKTREKLWEMFALKFDSFPLSTKLFGIICRSCKYIYHLPLQHTFIIICLFA